MSRAHWQGRNGQAARLRLLAAAAAAEDAAARPHAASRTEVDAINDRLRARAFDELEAEIAALPPEQQDIFRRIQRLLPETP